MGGGLSPWPEQWEIHGLFIVHLSRIQFFLAPAMGVSSIKDRMLLSCSAWAPSISCLTLTWPQPPSRCWGPRSGPLSPKDSPKTHMPPGSHSGAQPGRMWPGGAGVGGFFLWPLETWPLGCSPLELLSLKVWFATIQRMTSVTSLPGIQALSSIAP